MSPERVEIVNNCKIEEFWWAGEMCCYVNNNLSEHTFDENVRIAESCVDQSLIQGERE
jgi:hypothetical protein